MLSMLAGTELGRGELMNYIRSVVDVFIQLGRDRGKRIITDISFAAGSSVDPSWQKHSRPVASAPLNFDKAVIKLDAVVSSLVLCVFR